ncbi:DUF2474 domain-containing protein [Orrella marina]|uniref:DUF2474 domain-containing protein n=1 Tax=Orrella marina TaxID=2163011 RepID=A0A2R4XPP3_9BURK|nr:DUF2474 domain-containing protein [Orrella marina]
MPDRTPDDGCGQNKKADAETPLGRRLLWFLGLWLASVLALTVVSQIIRWAIMP